MMSVSVGTAMVSYTTTRFAKAMLLSRHRNYDADHTASCYKPDASACTDAKAELRDTYRLHELPRRHDLLYARTRQEGATLLHSRKGFGVLRQRVRLPRNSQLGRLTFLLAVALFIGMAGGPATAPSGGGGGSSADNNWGRDKDDDDLHWARRCAKATIQKLGKQPKSGLRR